MTALGPRLNAESWSLAAAARQCLDAVSGRGQARVSVATGDTSRVGPDVTVSD